MIALFRTHHRVLLMGRRYVFCPQQPTFQHLAFFISKHSALPLESLMRRTTGYSLGSFRAVNLLFLYNDDDIRVQNIQRGK